MEPMTVRSRAAAGAARRRRPDARRAAAVDAARSQPGAVGHAQSEVGAAARARDPGAPSRRRARHGHAAARRRRAARRSRPTASTTPRAPVRYRVGEGITGKVVESGKPIVVPRVSREPAFLNRAARAARSCRKQELSFICVPILLEPARGRRARRRPAFKAERDYDRSVQVPRHRRLDDRAGGQGPAAGRGGARSGWSTRTRTCGRSCASATTSRTSSAPAARCGRCTSRSRRSRRPTPPC